MLVSRCPVQAGRSCELEVVEVNQDLIAPEGQGLPGLIVARQPVFVSNMVQCRTGSNTVQTTAVVGAQGVLKQCDQRHRPPGPHPTRPPSSTNSPFVFELVFLKSSSGVCASLPLDTASKTPSKPKQVSVTLTACQPPCQPTHLHTFQLHTSHSLLPFLPACLPPSTPTSPVSCFRLQTIPQQGLPQPLLSSSDLKVQGEAAKPQHSHVAGPQLLLHNT